MSDGKHKKNTIFRKRVGERGPLDKVDEVDRHGCWVSVDVRPVKFDDFAFRQDPSSDIRGEHDGFKSAFCLKGRNEP